MNVVYIIDGCRTPIGSFNKGLSSLSAPQLGAIVIKETLRKVSCENITIDEVIMGQVCQANCGQAPARQAAILAQLPVSVSCTTVNKVCASGMKSIIFGSQSIICGENDVVIAGGQESMSNIPYYKLKKTAKNEDSPLIDGVFVDGLTDAYSKCSMGLYVENIADSLDINREAQDAFAKLSYQRSQTAAKTGLFDKEIIAVSVVNAEGEEITISEDEEWKRANFDRFSSLKPSFKSEGGTITAANASSMADGAACVMLASQLAVDKHQLRPIARVLGFADAAVQPDRFVVAPTEAIRKLLAKQGLTSENIARWEINEAFSVAVLANLQLLPDIDLTLTNVEGGAVSLGHPLGMSGARIVLHLAMNLAAGEKGIAAVCNGGGGASAILLEGC